MGFRSTNSSTVKVWAGWSLAHQAWLVAVETSGKLIAVGEFCLNNWMYERNQCSCQSGESVLTWPGRFDQLDEICMEQSSASTWIICLQFTPAAWPSKQFKQTSGIWWQLFDRDQLLWSQREVPLSLDNGKRWWFSQRWTHAVLAGGFGMCETCRMCVSLCVWIALAVWTAFFSK